MIRREVAAGRRFACNDRRLLDPRFGLVEIAPDRQDEPDRLQRNDFDLPQADAARQLERLAHLRQSGLALTDPIEAVADHAQVRYLHANQSCLAAQLDAAPEMAQSRCSCGLPHSSGRPGRSMRAPRTPRRLPVARTRAQAGARRRRLPLCLGQSKDCRACRGCANTRSTIAGVPRWAERGPTPPSPVLSRPLCDDRQRRPARRGSAAHRRRLLARPARRR